MTERIFDKDSYIREFKAKVLSCEKKGERFEILLDRTAFFPEGGGQAADTGNLGNARVTDTQEREREIYHYTDGALSIGEEVTGLIDWEQRFRRMQNHSGEHIVSGIIHREFGFNNVGFHMGADGITVDIDGELTCEELRRVEYMANRAVMGNVEIWAEYPAPDVLRTLDFRSKLELTENVRIVTIEGVDVCACCAPHVARTGEIGLIKILGFMRHRGGVRITMLSGLDALDDCNNKYNNVSEISTMLSAKQSEVSAAVRRVISEIEEKKQEIADLKKSIIDSACSQLAETDGNICRFLSIDMIGMRDVVNAGVKLCKGICAVFSGNDDCGYKYVMGSSKINMREKAKEINSALKGKGGGSTEMIQGSVVADRITIEEYFE